MGRVDTQQLAGYAQRALSYTMYGAVWRACKVVTRVRRNAESVSVALTAPLFTYTPHV
jgi:hypothetical protein